MHAPKSYLQFRRALRRYYQHETPAMQRLLLGRKSRRRWFIEYNHFIMGATAVCSDATCAVMLG